MRVRDRMSRAVATVREDEPLGLALQMMLWSDVRHLPVTRRGELIGLLSHRDIVMRRDGGGPTWHLRGHVSDAMTTPVETIDPDEDLETAAARMVTAKLGCLPVLERGDLVGILTMTDIAAHLAQCVVDRPLGKTSITEVMTPDPRTTTPDTALLEAATVMFDSGIRHLPVVVTNGAVVGMLSDRDVRSAFGDPLFGGADDELKVHRAMSRSPRTVTVEATVDDVVDVLLDARVGAVPVVDDTLRLVGLVSYADVLRHARSYGR